MNSQITHSSHKEAQPLYSASIPSSMALLLIEKHGPLMNHDVVATLLGRKSTALRNIINDALHGRHCVQPWIEKVLEARTKMGRKVLFKTALIADLVTPGFVLGGRD